MIRTARNRAWIVSDPAPSEFLDACPHHPLVATLLYHRTPHDPNIIQRFFEERYPQGLHDPFLLTGMREATDRIARAIATNEPIAVYGDYDADGITATALLTSAFQAMGAHPRYYIPDRVTEGYGLNCDAIQHLADEGIRLLITVDCGITNVAEVVYANDCGMEVIITDHHRPPTDLPPAYAIINPKQPGCPYPYKQLVGVGIAFKLVQALIKRPKKARHRLQMEGVRGRDLLELVALGTVADLGPLDGENRILVRAGLEAINMTERLGLLALIEAAARTNDQITATDIGFLLGPRINAAGRLGDATRAYELLMTDDPERADELAQELNRENQRRQRLMESIQQDAQQQATATGAHEQRIVMLGDESYHAGLVGLVASRLVEQWWRPVLLMEQRETVTRGSARSIPGFDIINALRTCEDLFTHLGGHSMAAGFTLPTDALPDLAERLLAFAEEHLSDSLLIPTLHIDAELPLADVTLELFETLATMAPFGQGNPEPILLIHGAEVLDAMATRDGKHLQLRLRQEGSEPIKAIAFHLGHLAESVRKHAQGGLDIVASIDANSWNGERSVQLNVKDFRRTPVRDLSHQNTNT